MNPDDLAASGFGLLFFAGHLVFAIGNCWSFPRKNLHLNRSEVRDYQKEALGLIVRGLAGLLVALAVLLKPRLLPATICLGAAILTLVLGRPIYETIAFAPRPRR